MFHSGHILETKQRLGSVASLDLWQSSQYDELTQNMRQNQDSQYADLLESVRVGVISVEHSALLCNGGLQQVDEQL